MTQLNLDSTQSNLERLLTSVQMPPTESIHPEKKKASVLLLIKRIAKFGQLKCKEISFIGRQSKAEDFALEGKQ